MDDFTKVWTDGSVINDEVIDNLSSEQLSEIEKLLEDIDLWATKLEPAGNTCPKCSKSIRKPQGLPMT